jgi:hypothetical protein
VGFELVAGFIGILQFVIKIRIGYIANSHSLQMTIARTESFQFTFSSLVLWYQFPTADFPFPGLPNYLRTTATENQDSQGTH